MKYGFLYFLNGAFYVPRFFKIKKLDVFFKDLLLFVSSSSSRKSVHVLEMVVRKKILYARKN